MTGAFVGDVRVGLIGCGVLARTHASCLREISGAATVAYCDLDRAAADRMLAEFGGEYATADVARVLEDEQIDAVYVLTRHDSHADLCVAALRAGKHVMVEKPLAMTVDDGVRVAVEAGRSRGKLMVGLKMRYFDMVLKAREMIPRPDLVVVQVMDAPWAAGGWANDPVAGGGSVLSQGCHGADLLRFLGGSDPQTVYAVGGNLHQPSGVVDAITAVVDFGGGRAGTWIAGDVGAAPVTSKFFAQTFAAGESVTLTDRLTTLTHRSKSGRVTVHHGSETGFAGENRAFVQAVRGGQDPPITVEDGLYATLTVMQGFASLDSAKPEPIASLAATMIAR